MRKELIISWSISLLPALLVGLFFGVFYKYHLFYQEQLQLFQSTADYFSRQLAHPGGLCAYLGGFITQFFYYAALGASVLALLALILQRLIANISNYISHKPLYALLTTLPSLAFYILFCDENILISGMVALILSAATTAICLRIKKDSFRLASFILMIPILYWLAGSAVLLFVLIMIPAEWLRKEKLKKRSYLYILTFAGILLFILSPLFAKILLPHYPVERFWLAGDYFRYVSDYRFYFYGLFALAAAISFLAGYLPDAKGKTGRGVLISLQIILLAVVCVTIAPKAEDWDKEEIMHYDYLARTENWKAMLELGEKKKPDGPLTVPLHNLALEVTGNLPGYAFNYFQKGGEGLLPSFRNAYLHSAITSDIYYRLGLINAAQYFAFEAMEGIPDYQKSVRCIKRLAETNLINGNYRVAEKYLSLLTNTLFYKKWATETLHSLGNEERINAHPEWGMLRKYRPQESFLFYEKDKTMMLESLSRQNPSNRMGNDYLLMYTLLQKDLKRFEIYYQTSNPARENRQVPRFYQEALALNWSLTQFDPAHKPAGLDNDVLNRLEQYRQVYISYPYPEPMLRESFGNTYFYYFHFR